MSVLVLPFPSCVSLVKVMNLSAQFSYFSNEDDNISTTRLGLDTILCQSGQARLCCYDK